MANFKHFSKCLLFFQRRFSSDHKALKKTVLFDFHVKNGAKMVGFAGYNMPLQYNGQSVLESHHYVRKSCGIFDVSHMLQVHIQGRDCVRFFESLVVADVEGLANGTGTLSLYTNENGGIMDDLIVTKVSQNQLYVVSNAGCADKILPYLTAKCAEYRKTGGEVEVQVLPNALLAVQGPLMRDVLHGNVSVDLRELGFMQSRECSVFSVDSCRITRCGYTGEDGVEISIPADRAEDVCQRILANQATRMIGLAARDSLRLEAGLCLYGNDIDETTTPAEAALLWTIGKSRRSANYPIQFPGWSKIIGQINKTVPIPRRRIGLLSAIGPVARGGSQVLNESHQNVGVVTSGMFSPILNANIAMAYLPTALAKNGQQVFLSVRNKPYSAKVVKMPFVPHQYFQKA